MSRSVVAVTVVRVRCRSSVSVPVSTIRPFRMMETRSARASTCARMWLDSRTVRPASRASRMHSWKTASMRGSRSRVGWSSSSRSTSPSQRGHQCDLLPVALGVGAALLGGVQVEPLAQLVPAGRVSAAAQPGEQVDRLAAGQVRPQLDVARDVGQAAVQADRVGPGVAAEQPGPPGVGAQHAEQDPDRGGLPGAVRPEEPVDVAYLTDRSSPSSAFTFPKDLCRSSISMAGVIVQPSLKGMEKGMPSALGHAGEKAVKWRGVSVLRCVAGRVGDVEEVLLQERPVGVEASVNISSTGAVTSSR